MPDSEALPDVTAMNRPTRIAHMLNRIDALEVEATSILEEQKALGLTVADVKKLQATRKTMAALMGGDILPKGVSL